MKEILDALERKLSRQRKWQLKMQREGRCIKCGEPSKKLRCKVCNDKQVELNKKGA